MSRRRGRGGSIFIGAVCCVAVLVACGSGSDQSTAAATATHGCPGRSYEVPAESQNPRADRELVPPDPLRALVCRYRGVGVGPKAEAVLSRRTLGPGHQLDALLGELASLKPTHGNGEAGSCSLDNGTKIYIDFRYAKAPPVGVTVGLSGCELVANSRSRGPVFFLSSTLRAMLVALVPG